MSPMFFKQNILPFVKKHTIEIALILKEKFVEKDAEGKTLWNRACDSIQKRFGVIISPEALKLATGYREQYMTELTWDDLIDYVKKTYDLLPGNRVCVFFREQADYVSLDIMIMDDDDTPLSTPKAPWIHLCLPDLDPTVRQVFGDKTLIVMK